ncbi:MAG: hypothetical protein ACSHXY_04565 [Alphaproteobacteria bacterium]
MVKFAKYAGYILGLFMVAMGAMKFLGDVPIFLLLENNLASKYGLELNFIDPGFKHVTGALELIAGGLLLFGQRLKGGLLSIFVIGGALLSHIFVLGISTPMSAEAGADKSPMLFIMASMFFMVSLWVTWSAKQAVAK